MRRFLTLNCILLVGKNITQGEINYQIPLWNLDCGLLRDDCFEQSFD